MNMFKGLGFNLRSEGVLGYKERKMQAIRRIRKYACNRRIHEIPLVTPTKAPAFDANPDWRPRLPKTNYSCTCDRNMNPGL